MILRSLKVKHFIFLQLSCAYHVTSLCLGDLEAAEQKCEKAKKELDATLVELNEI